VLFEGGGKSVPPDGIGPAEPPDPGGPLDTPEDGGPSEPPGFWVGPEGPDPDEVV